MTDRARNTIISWAVASVLAIAVFCFSFFFRGLTFKYASDACFFAAVVCLAWPVFVWTYRSGVFDTLNYAMVSLVYSFKRHSPKPYADAYSYKEVQKDKRERSKPVLYPYWIYAGVMLTLAILFLVLFYNVQ
ncbi:MAG: hypothetical protein BWY98_00114 [Tenericutes bacterium ADurb.BinA155]|nr:MAG: hypothetical protein BWY98_00114 [Tenericutes bacterium ADurb.BinA155]